MLLAVPSTLLGQKPGQKNYFEVGVAPSIGFKIMGKADPPKDYYGSVTQFRDSLSKADKPGQSLGFSVKYYVAKNAGQAFSIGLNYTDLTFRRVLNNPKLGDIIHPDPELIVAGLIQTGSLSVNYDFHWRYLEVPVLWYKSIERTGNFRDMDVFAYGGFSLAGLIQHRVAIKTIGFTVQEKDRYSFSNSGFKSMPVNVSAMAGLRVQYYMFKKWHAYLEPRFQVPLLPVATEMQMVWIPQLRLEAGFSFPLYDVRSK